MNAVQRMHELEREIHHVLKAHQELQNEHESLKDQVTQLEQRYQRSKAQQAHASKKLHVLITRIKEGKGQHT